MDKIRYRDLQRWRLGDVEKALPLTITSDSQSKMVLLSLEQYNKLVNDFKLAPRDSHRIENLEELNIIKSPEHYQLIRKNGEIIKQEVDLDGYPIYKE
jgi:hypothetical protein